MNVNSADDNGNIEVDVCGDDESLLSAYDEMLISSPAETCANDLHNILHDRKFFDFEFIDSCVEDFKIVDEILRERCFFFVIKNFNCISYIL